MFSNIFPAFCFIAGLLQFPQKDVCEQWIVAGFAEELTLLVLAKELVTDQRTFVSFTEKLNAIMPRLLKIRAQGKLLPLVICVKYANRSSAPQSLPNLTIVRCTERPVQRLE